MSRSVHNVCSMPDLLPNTRYLSSLKLFLNRSDGLDLLEDAVPDLSFFFLEVLLDPVLSNPHPYTVVFAK